MRSSPPSDEGIWDVAELEDKVIKPNQWGQVGSRAFKAFSVTHQHIPAGAYAVTKDNRDEQIIFVRKEIHSDDIMSFEGGLSQKIFKEINEFWKTEDQFKKYGFLHRRGYMLYGPQGTGKSSIVRQICNDVIKRGGIVLFCDSPRLFAQGLTVFRQVEEKRAIVCVFEDIDAIIKKHGDSELLQILDGDNQIDRVLNIATTNYPEVLDKRIISRPRRFDRLHKIVAPEEKIRLQYLKSKLPKVSPKEWKIWVQETKGLSFAGLTEAVISVKCLGNNLTDTIKILRDIESGHPSSDDFGSKIGFDSGGSSNSVGGSTVDGGD